MACAGSRLYDKEIIKYANTRPEQKDLLDSAQRWFVRHKFGMWVNNLRKRCFEIGKEAFIEEFGLAWISLLVHTSNYGNEAHLDMSDDCHGRRKWENVEQNA